MSPFYLHPRPKDPGSASRPPFASQTGTSQAGNPPFPSPPRRPCSSQDEHCPLSESLRQPGASRPSSDRTDPGLLAVSAQLPRAPLPPTPRCPPPWPGPSARVPRPRLPGRGPRPHPPPAPARSLLEHGCGSGRAQPQGRAGPAERAGPSWASPQGNRLAFRGRRPTDPPPAARTKGRSRRRPPQRHAPSSCPRPARHGAAPAREGRGGPGPAGRRAGRGETGYGEPGRAAGCRRRMRRGSKGKREGGTGERGRSRPGRDGGAQGGPAGEAETEGLGGAGGVERDREIDRAAETPEITGREQERRRERETETEIEAVFCFD